MDPSRPPPRLPPSLLLPLWLVLPFPLWRLPPLLPGSPLLSPVPLRPLLLESPPCPLSLLAALVLPVSLLDAPPPLELPLLLPWLLLAPRLSVLLPRSAPLLLPLVLRLLPCTVLLLPLPLVLPPVPGSLLLPVLFPSTRLDVPPSPVSQLFSALWSSLLCRSKWCFELTKIPVIAKLVGGYLYFSRWVWATVDNYISLGARHMTPILNFTFILMIYTRLLWATMVLWDT